MNTELALLLELKAEMMKVMVRCDCTLRSNHYLAKLMASQLAISKEQHNNLNKAIDESFDNLYSSIKKVDANVDKIIEETRAVK